MSNLAVSFQATPQIPPMHRYGGTLASNNEIAIHALGDTYSVEGSGTVTRLPALPRGPAVLLNFTGAPTFIASTKLLLPGGNDYTFSVGDSALVIPLGDGAWRVIGIYRADGTAVAAVWTNRRLAKTSAYLVTNADKGRTLALGGATQFAVTFGAASNYDSEFPIVVSNEDNGRGKTLLIHEGTSATSFAVGSGSKAFTTQSGLRIVAGMRFRAWSLANASNWMSGLVSSYSGTSLTISVDTIGGSGTLSDWQLAVETILWPLQTVTVFAQNGAWQERGSSRYAVKSPLVINVDPTSGFDTSDGLATGSGATKTIMAAASICWREVDHRGNLPTISVAGGATVTESISLTQFGQLTGASTVYIQGNGSQFIWKPASGYCVQFGDNSIGIISNIKFDGTGTTGAIAVSGHQTGIVDVNAGVEFGSFPSGFHFYNDTGFKININNNYAISGNYTYHLNSGGGVQFAHNTAITITVTNTPTGVTHFRMFGAGNAVVLASGSSYSGAHTAGMKQFDINGPSMVYAAGASIAGSVTGTTANGGVQF